jgi:hypothetical protein
MGEVQSVLAKAAVRLFWTRWLRLLVVLSTGAIAAALIALVLLRTGLLAQVDWRVLAISAAVAVPVLAALGALLTAPSRPRVARIVDAGADLKETLSTALHVQGQPGLASDAWATNVIESARHAARGVRLSAAVPVQAPRHWYAPGVAGLVLVIAWVTLPTMDLLGKKAQAQQAQAKQEDIKQAQAQAQAATAKVKAKADELLAKLGEDAPKADKPEDQAKPQTPDEIRRSAVKQLTSLQQQLEKLKQTPQAQTAQMMRDKMSQLRGTSGPLQDFTSQLAKGDISGAQAALETLAKSMSAGQMNPQQAQALQANLQNLAKQLEKLSQEKKELEQKLAQAGVDPKLAGQPQALAEALKNNQQLSEQQKQALQNAAQAQQNTNQAAQAMAQACNNMAQAMNQQGQQGQQGAQAMQQMQQALDQMQMAQADLNSLEAAMSEAKNQQQQLSDAMGQCNSPGMGECQGGLGNGNGQADAGQTGEGQGEPGEGNGAGRGGPGISAGGDGVGEAEAPETWQKRKSASPLTAGPMIGTMLVQGEQVKGESRAQLVAMTEAAAQQATEAIESNAVPRELQDAVKRYFGNLQKKVKSNDVGQPAPAPAGSPAPAPAPADTKK